MWRIGQGSNFTYWTLRRSEFESQRKHTVFPQIIAVPQLIASLRFSPSSLSFIPSLSSWREIWSSKTISVIIQALKINQGTKFGTLKKPIIIQFIWCNNFFIQWDNKTKYLRAWLPVSNIWNNCPPQIIAPFWWEKRNNCHQLLFKEIRYFQTLYIFFPF